MRNGWRSRVGLVLVVLLLGGGRGGLLLLGLLVAVLGALRGLRFLRLLHDELEDVVLLRDQLVLS